MIPAKGFLMAQGQHSVDLDPSVYAKAKQMAEREHVTIEVLLGSLVRHRADYVDSFEQMGAEEGFSLADWEMDRVPGESDAEYEARLDLFR